MDEGRGLGETVMASTVKGIRISAGQDGRVRVKLTRKGQSVSRRIGAEKKAERQAKAWAKASKRG